MRAPDSYAGTVMNCPACGKSLKVPTLDDLGEAETAIPQAPIKPAPAVKPAATSAKSSAASAPATPPVPVVRPKNPQKVSHAAPPIPNFPLPSSKPEPTPDTLEPLPPAASLDELLAESDDNLLSSSNHDPFGFDENESLSAATTAPLDKPSATPNSYPVKQQPDATAEAETPSTDAPFVPENSQATSKRSALPKSAKAPRPTPAWLAHPALDIVFALLALFISVLAYAHAGSGGPSRPDVSLATEAEGSAGLLIQITADDKLTLAGQPVASPEDLTAALQARGTPSRVTISAAPNTLFDTILRAVAASGRAGVATVQVSTTP